LFRVLEPLGFQTCLLSSAEPTFAGWWHKFIKCAMKENGKGINMASVLGVSVQNVANK